MLIIDEIHLLGADRGPILEVIVSRMRYIAAQVPFGVALSGLGGRAQEGRQVNLEDVERAMHHYVCLFGFLRAWTQTERTIRFVGLSTALANAQDLADWLGITGPGLFNFKPSVRPVPLECHIQVGRGCVSGGHGGLQLSCTLRSHAAPTPKQSPACPPASAKPNSETPGHPPHPRTRLSSPPPTLPHT